MIEITDKLLNWASQIDPQALVQAGATSRMPFVERVALMPDAHVGMGSTVGSVIGTNGAIMPAAVGVDIGCGMAAVEFDMTAEQLPDLEPFMPKVERAIPAGVGEGHAETSRQALLWYKDNIDKFSTKLDNRLTEKLLSQFGSLGSGNHFFEVCLDERDKVWLVLHSGSRGLGNILGMRHIDKAKKLCEANHIGLENKDLAYFMDTDDGFNLYIADMLAAQEYARANREQMLHNVIAAWNSFLGGGYRIVQTINCHHNFTQLEEHEGHKLWITRKGAIKADHGDLGIIPGSMGTKTYIVEGLGNGLSYNSCSHGAGRVHSRSAAKRLFTEQDLETAMAGKVWLHGKAGSLVDEIPAAYKDVDQVMEDQKDLVKPLHTLRQVFNYKGC